MIAAAGAGKLFASGKPRPAAELVAQGRCLAERHRVGRNRFLDAADVPSEVAAKRRAMAERRITQHAHIGFRSLARTADAIAEIHARAAEEGVTVDRFGITLDWSMGYPAASRAGRPRGTGIVMDGPEDFRRLTDAAPAATHCGDFMLGLPAALENTQAALAAGVTTLGNLGQYFTFRLLGWDDDVATTEATVTAIALIAAQDVEVLVHSNLDDGFAALFRDMSSSIGMVLLEKYIVEELLGARVAHCYGHHFTDPATRHAFHAALVQVSDTPGSMIYGNTVSYRSAPAGNYADCASYLLTDILSLTRFPSGHAINPVPVTENTRIPAIDEILDAQLFAGRLVQCARRFETLIDWRAADTAAAQLVAGGRAFARNTMDGLVAAGVDISDAGAMLLALRQIGPRLLENLYGAGTLAGAERRPVVPACWVGELDEMADAWCNGRPADAADLRGLTVCIGTTDVHEHGKYLVTRAFAALGVGIVDAGAAVDPAVLVARARECGADAIAISTYNGVAVRYAREVMAELERGGCPLPVLVGGRLNEIRDGSNSDLPTDASADLAALGAVPCAGLDAAAAAMAAIARRKQEAAR
jgi:methylmalonyl-CoA mutase cobalamin-binding subunit